MNAELSDEALEYGHAVMGAIEAAGGDALVQRAEADPSQRAALEPLLTKLGAWELEPRTDPAGLEAAASLARNAGYWAIPYPVAERLAKPIGVDCDGLVVVDPRFPAAYIAGTGLRWAGVDMAGRRSRISVVREDLSRHGAFHAQLALEPLDGRGRADLPLALILPCWALLGMLDRAVTLTTDYIKQRRQFGQPLSSFQALQFQLTDAELERVGLEEMAKYALWSSAARPEASLADALALRVAAIEAATVVFRVAHQLHGAIGFCDETTVSWISRYSRPIRQSPFGLSESRDHLAAEVGRRGLSGLFDDEPYVDLRDERDAL